MMERSALKMPALEMFFRLMWFHFCLSRVQFLQVVLGTAVILEVRHDHIRVRVAQVAGNLVEVLAVPALFQQIQNCHRGIIAS